MENKINCPKCDHEFDVEHALSGKIEARYAAEQKRFISEQKELIEEAAKKMSEERQKKLEVELESKFMNQMTALKSENEKKAKENEELKKKELDFLQKEQALKEKADNLELDMKKQLLQKTDEIKAQGAKEEQDKFELERMEYERKLADQKKLTEEMKRKMEQGSMQMQGEVQELAIEDWLQTNFPLDTIEEIKKGQRGGDCVQIVNTREAQNCGEIYYESKRTKDFQASWIEKFKGDIRDRGADIGVLVTEVMPKDMERMGMKEGIWICTFNEFKGLSAVLRQTIIKLNASIISQENKGDKMHMLYDFLTSASFRMQIEAIVEGFTQMKSDLEKEKRSMQKIWKQREKQIEKVVINTIDMYGSIKGIAGNAIQTVNALELGEGTELDDLD